MKINAITAAAPLLAAISAHHSNALAQGVMDELRAWEAAAPTRDAERQAALRKEQAAMAPCKGEKALCATQLLAAGWDVVSSGYEPLGLDSGLEFKLMQKAGQQRICTTYISYDGSSHERPCHEMFVNTRSVKN